MKENHRFILPELAAVQEAAAGEGSYSIHNYYGHGFIARAKRQRFQKALDLGSGVDAENVLDMGTAEGVLLPTLSRHYRRVVALDINEEFIARSRRLCESLKLSNVELICSAGLSFEALSEKIGPGFKLMYLLETLEHVGSQPDVWGSKMAFLRECFSLLEPDGRIVVTVPKMVGPILLFKNVLQRALRIGHDNLTLGQLLRSSLFNDTEALEALWHGGHVGFNHLKLEQHLAVHFRVLERTESVMSTFYVLARKA